MHLKNFLKCFMLQDTSFVGFLPQHVSALTIQFGCTCQIWMCNVMSKIVSQIFGNDNISQSLIIFDSLKSNYIYIKVVTSGF
jgi:hypothetical protein